jgi:uncharacterized membrane protein YgcG
MWETRAVTQSSKVVPLKAPENAAGRSNHSLPPILHSVRQTARRSLSGLLSTLFNNADDVLFEMADRSRNDSDQHMYFDSMREIRVHRKRISTEFGQKLYAAFDVLYLPVANDDEEPTDFETAVDNMTLVKNDDLEISVAVAGIVSKVTSQFSLPVMQLTRRIDSLCPNRTVTERMNPLGPHQLGTAFVAATECLEIDIRVRIVLLKLFERFVMEHLGQAYDDANRVLAEAGVLPDLRNVLKKEASTQRASTPRPNSPQAGHGPAGQQGHSGAGGLPGSGSGASGASGSGSGSGGGGASSGGAGSGFAMPGSSSADSDFTVLQQLLANQPDGHYGGTGYGSGSSRGIGGAAYSGPVGPVISTPDLMSVLSVVQSAASAEPIDINQVPVAIDLRQLVLTRAADVTGAPAGAMGRADEDTVNLVGMLFDYILNDRNLAIPMKALIGRLQIPMLKVAILDKTFFSKTSHPARQLLNELSSAGIGWSSAAELKRDALYNKIESVVLRVLNNFSDDPEIFATLVTELRQFVQQDHHRVQIVEQRVKEVEAGRAKTISAKLTVERLVNQKASGLRLPPEVGRFISDLWSRVLVYLCIRNGEEGAEWSDAVQTFDDLLWSVQPLDALADIEERDRARPRLLDRVERGLEMIGLSGGEIEDAVTMLEERLGDIAASDRAFLEEDRPQVEARELPVMEEIVLTSPGEVEPIDNAEPEPEMVREINRLTEGVWVEMANDDGQKTRCKVAAIVQPGSKYIFVNRRGMKVAERTRMALAVELKRKSITILDESQVFDRALEAVIGNLRQLHRQPK